MPLTENCLDVSLSLQQQWPEKMALVTSGVALFSRNLRREVKGEHVYLQASIESYLSLLERGGKRARGVLTIVGYELFGGRNTAVIATAAGIVEAEHAYLLVMDDVADNSVLRRGGPTAHMYMKDFLVWENIRADKTKLAIDAAQNAALVAQHVAQSALLRLKVPAKQKVLAAAVLNQRLVRTGVGQLLDMVSTTRDDLSEREILKIAAYKTAYYSFLLPLQVGAALAGASRSELQPFTPYCKYAGLAFQLQDDVIGLFGDQALTGKTPMSDIIEGKQTYLITTTLRRADTEQLRFLRAALGDKTLSSERFSDCLNIIRATGALDKTQSLIKKYTAMALASLENAPREWPARQVQFLRDMAVYGAQRQL